MSTQNTSRYPLGGRETDGKGATGRLGREDRLKLSVLHLRITKIAFPLMFWWLYLAGGNVLEA